MDMKKKEYTKPSIKLVEREFSKTICSTVYTASPSIKIVDDYGGTTRVDHRSSNTEGSIKWNNFPSSGKNN